MLKITSTIQLKDEELSYDYIRATGPGGQNVNKVSSAVQLRFDAASSTALSGVAKDRLRKLAGSRMTQSGILVIEAKRYRTQEQNRLDAEQRLVALVQKSLVRPKKRHPTHPTSASIARRLESKKRRSAAKRLRNASSGLNE